jgi:hypothetical protein
LGSQEPHIKPLLEILNSPIRVASNVWSTREKQPVSVTTITRAQIEPSGACTLNDFLSLRVPGFFKVEDQDDTIAAFRGLAADNNSKEMFLLNGQALSADEERKGLIGSPAPAGRTWWVQTRVTF